MRSRRILPRIAFIIGCVVCLAGVARANQTQVEVISFGAEPREALQYSVQPGQEEVLFVTIDKAVEDSVDNRPASFTEAPTTVLSIHSIVKQVRDDGTFEYEFTIENADFEADPSADKNMQQVARQAMNALDGVSGVAAVKPNGVVEHLSFNLGAKADTATQRLLQQLRQVFNQIHCVLPQEPVGKGAQWKVVHKLDENAKTISESAEVTLVSRDADKLVLDVRMQFEAEPQQVRWAKLAETTKIDLLSYEGTGRADVSIDLGKVYPIDSEVNLQSLETTRIKAQSVQLNTRTSVSMKIRMQTTDVKRPNANGKTSSDEVLSDG